MRNVIIVELWLAALPASLFLAAYGPPWRWRDRTYSWHISTFTLVILALVGLLLAATYRLTIPPWLAMGVLGALAAVLWWLFILFVLTQSRAK